MHGETVKNSSTYANKSLADMSTRL